MADNDFAAFINLGERAGEVCCLHRRRQRYGNGGPQQSY